MIGVGSLGVMSSPALAAPCAPGDFLGFKAWYEGLECGSDGGIVWTGGQDDESGSKLSAFVWRIVLNVIFDLTWAIACVALAMIIYGGYQYMMSQGDPGKAAKGKKTLTSAVTGAIIAMGASVIVNTLMLALSIDRSAGAKQTFSTADLQGVFSWAYTMSGIVAVIFVIKSGMDYMLSQGDPGKVKQATRGMIFSVVGLVIVILASVITRFIIDSVAGAL